MENELKITRDKLAKLSELIKEKSSKEIAIFKYDDELKKKLDINNDPELKKIKPRKPSEPSPYIQRDKPIKPSKNNNPVILILLIVLILFMAFLAINFVKKQSTWKKIYHDCKLGNSYRWNEWVNTWSTVDSFDDLSATWNRVENEWISKYDIRVSWDKIYNIYEKKLKNKGTIYSNNLLVEFSNESEKYSNYLTILFWPFVVLIIIFIKIVKNYRHNSLLYEELYKKYQNDYQSFIENEKYKNEYSKLLDVYNKKKKNYDLKMCEFNKIVSEKKRSFMDENKKKIEPLKLTAQKELDEINTRISKYNDLISSNYYGVIDEIIRIIDNGRAATLIDAINVYEADEKSNELIRLQRQYNLEMEMANERRERLERERIKQEEYYQNIANKREEDRIKREEEKLKQEEINRYRAQRDAERDRRIAESVAKSNGSLQCSSCAHSFDCGFKYNNRGNCASYAFK